MCGISGIFNLNKRLVDVESLKSMNNAISHRGPDGDGFWFNQKGYLGLGHRRLSILDLSDLGKQPMSLGGRYTITYNGEIFNFLEIKSDLEDLGYSFSSESDTEVILASYHQWGKECLERFNGMWAFAIWDDLKEELFLARDHFGIKPLYFTYTENQHFIFGSETNQFKFINGHKFDLSIEALNSEIRVPFKLEGYGKTIYKNIEGVRAGEYLVVSKMGLIRKSWWNTLDYKINISSKYENQIEDFYNLLTDSLKLRLRSDVPIGTALSGGLDSSTIFCLLNKIKSDINGKRIPNGIFSAFTAVFPDTSQDELNFAKIVANHTNSSLNQSCHDLSTLNNELIDSVRNFDVIYSTPLISLSKIYSTMRENNITVSLDGHGVDEMMYGYPFILPLIIKDYHEKGNFKRRDDIIKVYKSMYMKGKYPPNELKFLDGKFRTYMGRIDSKFSNKKVGNEWLNDLTFPEQQNLVEFQNAEFGEGILFEQFHRTQLPTILRNFDKASMRSGVEIRMPFLDHRLVSYVFKLPMQSKIGNGYTKRILRDSMIGVLPNEIRKRKTKLGFLAPMDMWFKGSLKPFVLESINSPEFLNSNLWNGKKILSDVNLWYQDKSRIDTSKLWLILNTFLIIQNNSHRIR